MDNCFGIEVLQICVGLSSAYENNGLTSDVGHRDGSSNLENRKNK